MTLSGGGGGAPAAPGGAGAAAGPSAGGAVGGVAAAPVLQPPPGTSSNPFQVGALLRAAEAWTLEKAEAQLCLQLPCTCMLTVAVFSRLQYKGCVRIGGLPYRANMTKNTTLNAPSFLLGPCSRAVARPWRPRRGTSRPARSHRSSALTDALGADRRLPAASAPSSCPATSNT